MSDSTKDLKDKWQAAEAEAIRLQNEKDDAIDKVRAKYGDRLRKKVEAAAAAQKKFLDAEATDALRERPDQEAAAAKAAELGLSLD